MTNSTLKNTRSLFLVIHLRTIEAVNIALLTLGYQNRCFGNVTATYDLISLHWRKKHSSCFGNTGYPELEDKTHSSRGAACGEGI